VQVIIDGLGHSRSYSGYLLQVSNSGAQYAGQTAKVCEQCPPARRTQSRYRLEY
jgi:hypothetical protein